MHDAPRPLVEAGPPDGRPVLLLHGFPQSKESWHEVQALLADRGLRAVAFDQRGYVPGDRPARPELRVDALAANALRVADSLGFDTVDVVGHDWGGMVAWYLAANHPDRLRTATVVATPHPRAFASALAGTQALRSLYAAGFQIPVLPELMLRAGRGAPLRAMLRASGLSRDHADAYADAMLADGVLSGALGWYRANGPAVLRKIGPSVVPTLYVWPSADAALGRRAAEGTAGQVEAPYRFEVLAGASHWVPEQHPAALAALVAEHLEPVRR